MRKALRELIDAINVTFCKLEQIQFSAPWNPRTRGC